MINCRNIIPAYITHARTLVHKARLKPFICDDMFTFEIASQIREITGQGITILIDFNVVLCLENWHVHRKSKKIIINIDVDRDVAYYVDPGDSRLKITKNSYEIKNSLYFEIPDKSLFRTYIHDIPDEIIGVLLSFADMITCVSLLATCTKFRKISIPFKVLCEYVESKISRVVNLHVSPRILYKQHMSAMIRHGSSKIIEYKGVKYYCRKNNGAIINDSVTEFAKVYFANKYNVRYYPEQILLFDKWIFIINTRRLLWNDKFGRPLITKLGQCYILVTTPIVDIFDKREKIRIFKNSPFYNIEIGDEHILEKFICNDTIH